MITFATLPSVSTLAQHHWDGTPVNPSGMVKGVVLPIHVAPFQEGLLLPHGLLRIFPLPLLTIIIIEMRVCRPTSDGSTPIEIIELYVQ